MNHSKALLYQTAYIVTVQNWKQVITGMSATLNYLSSKNVLHNDMKCDNILIELPGDSVEARAILIEFNNCE